MFIGKHEIAGKACIMGILNVTPDSFSDGCLLYTSPSPRDTR